MLPTIKEVNITQVPEVPKPISQASVKTFPDSFSKLQSRIKQNKKFEKFRSKSTFEVRN
jgi:hypothetical protein